MTPSQLLLLALIYRITHYQKTNKKNTFFKQKDQYQFKTYHLKYHILRDIIITQKQGR